MSRELAKAALAVLPTETREACAVFIEESRPWLDPSFEPSPGCHCDISRALAVVAEAIRRLPAEGEWQPAPEGGLIVHF